MIVSKFHTMLIANLYISAYFVTNFLRVFWNLVLLWGGNNACVYHQRFGFGFFKGLEASELASNCYYAVRRDNHYLIFIQESEKYHFFVFVAALRITYIYILA